MIMANIAQSSRFFCDLRAVCIDGVLQNHLSNDGDDDDDDRSNGLRGVPRDLSHDNGDR